MYFRGHAYYEIHKFILILITCGLDRLSTISSIKLYTYLIRNLIVIQS